MERGGEGERREEREGVRGESRKRGEGESG